MKAYNKSEPRLVDVDGAIEGSDVKTLEEMVKLGRECEAQAIAEGREPFLIE